MKKSKRRLTINAVIIFILIICSMFIGATAKELYWSEQEETVYIEDYLDDGEFRGVEVRLYEGWDESFEKYGYTGNFTSSMNGFYDKGDVIFLNTANKTGSGMLRTLFHEYGHHVWNKVLSPDERERYRMIYLSADLYVSTYALEGGVEEDFAETYEAIMIGFEGVPRERLAFFYEMRREHPQSI